jgi:hypothetical protein
MTIPIPPPADFAENAVIGTCSDYGVNVTV